MPTIFAHGAIGFVASKFGSHRPSRRIILASILAATLPDIDALFFGLIPYNAPFGHRGFTHSLFFAALIGLLLGLVFHRTGWGSGHSFLALATLFFVVTASHGLFDAMTNGGLGIAFFAPFDNTRYFLPWRPIPVAPLSAQRLFSPSGFHVIVWEAGLFGPFTLAAIIWDRRSVWRRFSAVACAIAGAVMWFVAINGSR